MGSLTRKHSFPCHAGVGSLAHGHSLPCRTSVGSLARERMLPWSARIRSLAPEYALPCLTRARTACLAPVEVHRKLSRIDRGQLMRSGQDLPARWLARKGAACWRASTCYFSYEGRLAVQEMACHWPRARATIKNTSSCTPMFSLSLEKYFTFFSTMMQKIKP